MCQTCGNLACSGQCSGSNFPYNRPFYNPPFTSPFNRNCLPVVPPVPAYPCPTCGPCAQVGCLQSITTDCVVTTMPYPCLGNTAINTNLTTVLNNINSILCNIPTGNTCQVKVTESDPCCDYLSNKITSSSLVITTPTNTETGCVTLNLEVSKTTRPTIYLNSNQNGTDNFSIPLPTPPLVTGDVVVDFDGKVSYSHATATPTFDFNIKGNRTVFVDTNLFAKYAYNNNPVTGSYSIAPPKHYLGDSFNSQNFEELVYETEILYNCDEVVVPAPTTNYDTIVSYYLNGFGGVVINAYPTTPIFKVVTKLTVRRVSNTSAIFIHELKIIPGTVVTTSYGGYFGGYESSAIDLTIFGTVVIGTSLDVDALTYEIQAKTAVSSIDGLKYQILDSKITLNKF